MRIKCPCCSHKFTIIEDNIFFDYAVDYNDSKKYVWEKLPLLKSTFCVNSAEKNQTERQQ